MIKEAIEYIVGMKKPHIEEINGQTYSDKSLTRISYNPKAEEISMFTLSSLVEYIHAHIDEMPEKMVVHVQSPTRVRLYSSLDHERRREYLVSVVAEVPTFKFNDFVEHESFCINVQSKFIDNEDRALLLKFAGTVEAGSVAEYGDDGISQKATVKTGIASKGEALVPSPLLLIPYRTFPEVEQPESEFVFRMKQGKYEGILCGLFEADGGAWKIAAMQNIKEYLRASLEGTSITVIS